jgi:hypothetical protein
MKRGSLIIAVVLLMMTVSLVIVTLGYPLRSKLFPLIALGTALILLVIQVFREVSALNRQGTLSEKGTAKRPPAKHWGIWAWLVGTLVMLWIIGFMGTVVLLPFLYLRFNKESWFISVTLPLGCGVFFYVLFGLALDMPLYPGIVYPRFFE